MNPPVVIRPEAVASKLAALHNFQAPAFAAAVQKEPRLVELLWLFQYLSFQPGGHPKFSEDFISAHTDRIGTKAMHRIGKKSEPYTASERQEIISEFPGGELYKGMEEESVIAPMIRQFEDEMFGEMNCATRIRRSPNLAFVNKQNHSYFYAVCRDAGIQLLSKYLEDYCTKPDAVLPDVWWFDDLPGALLKVLDTRAASEAREIVLTEVATQSIDALEFAWQEKAMVEIIGDSRFGKTESVKAYCAMHPGRARLVKTPCDNTDRSLFEAIAEAVGIELSLKLTVRELKSKVEFVLKHCGLMFVFDEAAWLIPQRYTEKTAPMRLNYIRSKILECGCAVGLVTTPQFFDPAANRFEKVTSFNMAQWRGRIMRTVHLAAELSEHDLSAVARHHFPELTATGIKRVIGCALICESYLFAVLKISKNARAFARKNGRDQISLEDLEAGIALAGIDLPKMPSAPVATPPAERKSEQPIAVKRGTRPARTSPAREITPRQTATPLETANT